MSPIALAGFADKSRGSSLFLLTIFAFISCLSAMPTISWAQRADLVEGSAIVSAFSGLAADEPGNRVLDPDGISLRAFDLSDLGAVSNGSRAGLNALLAIPAKDIGQIFAIAIGGAEQPAIYLGATSLYGLYRSPDNDEWDPVMWGRNGGPGTIYRLHPDNGYQPEAFTDIRNARRENSGPGLGDIVADTVSGKLFVSDLETGLIHSVDIESGEMVETYDHGVDGRANFLDPATNTYETLDSVSWDILGAGPGICGAQSTPDAAQRFMSDPACWGYSAFQRRVFALGIQRTDEAGTARLYYSVWGSTSFENPDWEMESIESQNSIWSIALDNDGTFDLTDIRREIIMPAFYEARQDRARFGESQPVASITFADDGAMLVAERGIPLGFDAENDGSPIVLPASARILRFSLEERIWVADREHGEQGNNEPSQQRTSSSGGVALGYGYSRQGRIDPGSWGATVWTTSDQLCDAGEPCRGDDNVGGLQGIPVTVEAELIPAPNYIPNPSRGQVTSANGQASSYFVEFGAGDQPVASLGDVAILETYGGVPSQPPSPSQPSSPSQGAVDLKLAMRAEQPTCGPDGNCRFTLELSNAGNDTYRGQLMFENTVGANFNLDTIWPNDWSCVSTSNSYHCYTPNISLQAGRSIDLNLAYHVQPGITESSVRNCAALAWPDQGGRGQILAVQIALKRLGFDAGTPDGLSGPRTRGAIEGAERANGLRPTGQISDGLLEILFGPGRGNSPDYDPGNDSDCTIVEIDIPPPPAHADQISSFHTTYRSNTHDANTSAHIQSHDRAISAFHRKFRSSMYQGENTRQVPIHRRPLSQFHQRNRSSRHDGTVSRGVDIHDAEISQFHNRYQSSLHNFRTSQRYPVHVIGRSEFHQTYRSWIHDGVHSQQIPVD